MCPARLRISPERNSPNQRMPKKSRCPWPGDDPLMVKYHDREWGVPLHNDRKLFEFLVLAACQAGLSWAIILKKRKNFRKAFDNFHPARIAKYSAGEVKRLLNDEGIIRNRAKIEDTITNARKFLEVKKEFGSFDKYIWQFTNHGTVRNGYKTLKELPAKTSQSDAMSTDLKERGF